MRTEILNVDPQSPGVEAIARAAAILRSGGIVAFPTETVYGLGANALNAAAVAKIFEAKRRPPQNPVIVHVNDEAAARELVTAWPDNAARLAARFWPGPLSLVLPRRAIVPDIVTAGGPTVAVRVPSHAVARALIAASGVPLAAPSANQSSRISATTADHVRRTLDGRIDMILDGGPTSGGLESTVLDLSSDPPRLLRPGLVSLAQIEQALGESIAVGSANEAKEQALPSPGMLSRHYAPSVPLECIAENSRGQIEALARSGMSIGWLPLGEPPSDLPANVIVRPMPRDPVEYSALLFATLYALEDANVERIIAELPPDTPEWLAVRDRLRRASAPH